MLESCLLIRSISLITAYKSDLQFAKKISRTFGERTCVRVFDFSRFHRSLIFSISGLSVYNFRTLYDRNSIEEFHWNNRGRIYLDANDAVNPGKLWGPGGGCRKA